MKAVVLVGGEGTRMRPLTETVPKPLLPLMDRHALDHVLDHLARHGVHEVVRRSPYLEQVFHPFIEARHGEPTITWITETHALGTGGAIVNALDVSRRRTVLRVERRHTHRPGPDGDEVVPRLIDSAAVTIALHHVDDARAFGLVATDDDGRVLEFREKPEEPIPGDVNAGTYLLDPAVLREWSPGGDDLDRARRLPGGDRGGASGLRIGGRRVLARPRHAREVPAGALRHVRGKGARGDVSGAMDRRRGPRSTSRLTSVDGWRSGPARRSPRRPDRRFRAARRARAWAPAPG